eukprot:comp18344_c0_seq1/m.19464 comp18344_c0_seq1/g.19464  ORF comp18344_c0_seq1/g.19464 comp18344_c0_seq1/m.19464 type:complete len:239 (-) comp18344_c0_seq1:88-804(-)
MGGQVVAGVDNAVALLLPLCAFVFVFAAVRFFSTACSNEDAQTDRPREQPHAPQTPARNNGEQQEASTRQSAQPEPRAHRNTEADGAVGGEDGSESRAEGLVVRLKVGETERTVHVRADTRADEFKRREFSTELTSGKSVRLIFGGRELSGGETFEGAGVTSSTVIHCIVNQAPAGRNLTDRAPTQGAGPGQFFGPLMAAFIATVVMTGGAEALAGGFLLSLVFMVGIICFIFNHILH